MQRTLSFELVRDDGP